MKFTNKICQRVPERVPRGSSGATHRYIPGRTPREFPKELRRESSAIILINILEILETYLEVSQEESWKKYLKVPQKNFWSNYQMLLEKTLQLSFCIRFSVEIV